MKALVVYESMWGNTRRVAEAIGGAMADRMEIRMGDVSDIAPEEAGSYDLVVVGAPTHALSLSRPNTRTAAHEQGAPDTASTTGLREWIAGLPEPTNAVLACFDTPSRPRAQAARVGGAQGASDAPTRRVEGDGRPDLLRR
jgi:hypothetical protein